MVRELIVPNLKTYEMLIKDEISEESPRRAEAERVLGAIMAVLTTLQEERAPLMNGNAGAATTELKERLVAKVGDVVGTKIAESGQLQLAHAVLGD